MVRSIIDQRRFWRRITHTRLEKARRSLLIINSLPIPRTTRIVAPYRSSQAGSMRSSSAFRILASGGLVLLASVPIPAKAQTHRFFLRTVVQTVLQNTKHETAIILSV